MKAEEIIKWVLKEAANEAACNSFGYRATQIHKSVLKLEKKLLEEYASQQEETPAPDERADIATAIRKWLESDDVFVTDEKGNKLPNAVIDCIPHSFDKYLQPSTPAQGEEWNKWAHLRFLSDFNCYADAAQVFPAMTEEQFTISIQPLTSRLSQLEADNQRLKKYADDKFNEIERLEKQLDGYKDENSNLTLVCNAQSIEIDALKTDLSAERSKREELEAWGREAITAMETLRKQLKPYLNP
jgi:hypothetical protein